MTLTRVHILANVDRQAAIAWHPRVVVRHVVIRTAWNAYQAVTH